MLGGDLNFDENGSVYFVICFIILTSNFRALSSCIMREYQKNKPFPTEMLRKNRKWIIRSSNLLQTRSQEFL
jgi:hypothetical protein